MQCFFTPSLRILLVCMLLGLPFARAETGAVCADPRMVVEGRLEERYLEPVVRLCEALGTLRDLDSSARLRIVPAADGVIAEVTLEDGRVALRRVSDPAQLRTTIEALLVLPPSPPVMPTPTPSPSAVTTRASASNRTTNDARLGLEIGLSFMARLSRSPTYFSSGPSAHAGIRSSAWLLGLLLRWEPSQSLAGASPPGFEMETVGVGFVVARRVIASRGVALEAGATATLLNETQSAQFGAEERAGTQTDVRAGVITRVLVGSNPWLFTPTVQAELSPGRMRRDIRVDDALPPLPAWSVAAGVGITWEAP